MQQKAQGFWNSTGASFGFGERGELLQGTCVLAPGVGSYNLRKEAGENINPKWA